MQFGSGAQSFQALKDINLVVNQGDVHLLMGPSGSGKTTLLSILGGILHPSTGKVQALGQNLLQLSRSQLSEFRLNHFGFIFQEFNLLPTLTAAENIELILKLKGSKKREIHPMAMHLLEQVGLADRADRLPRNLSGGQKQRVAIARALAGSPQILMADEPTAALDSQSGHAVISLLRRLAKEAGHTVIMVTHDPRIMDVADQITYLEDGELQEQRTGKRSKGQIFPLSA
ncbi:MAG: ABC transporter ATP-binding protein [Elainellaceae cyanobacterium]